MGETKNEVMTLANCPVMLTSEQLVLLNVKTGGSNNEGELKEQDASKGIFPLGKAALICTEMFAFVSFWPI